MTWDPGTFAINVVIGVVASGLYLAVVKQAPLKVAAWAQKLLAFAVAVLGLACVGGLTCLAIGAVIVEVLSR